MTLRCRRPRESAKPTRWARSRTPTTAASGRLLTNVVSERPDGGAWLRRQSPGPELQRITHKVGATPISEFLYGRDHLADRITTWSQQAGATPPSLHTFGYDAVNQLLSATVTNSGNLVNTFAYAYDPAGNRLTEQVGASNYTATYNALNQISTTTAPGSVAHQRMGCARIVLSPSTPEISGPSSRTTA